VPGTGAYDGKPTVVPDNEVPENRDALTRENESAQDLSNLYNLFQNPKMPEGVNVNPDYRINGYYYDCYAPNGSNARNIWDYIKREKVERGQASRIVLNLDDSGVSLSDLRKQFQDWPMEGLEDMIVMKNRQPIPFWDFLH